VTVHIVITRSEVDESGDTFVSYEARASGELLCNGTMLFMTSFWPSRRTLFEWRVRREITARVRRYARTASFRVRVKAFEQMSWTIEV
jgi:hypothetical protein